MTTARPANTPGQPAGEMPVLVYARPNEMELRTAPVPEPAANEVLLRIEAVGICGSDMHAFHGHDPRRLPGLILGHEFAGTVVNGPAAGRRVTGNPLITCGRCEYCRQGRTNLCSDRTMIGMNRPGAFAAYMAAPERILIDLPATLSAAHGALAEPAATAWHAIALGRKSLVKPLTDARVLVIGGGAIGMLSALLLRSIGAGEVWVAETHAARRESIARHTGANTFDPGDQTGPGPDSCDLVLDAVGAASTRTMMLEAANPGSVAVHIGLLDWASEIDMRKLTLAEITLIGSYTYTDQDLADTVDALAGGEFGDLTWVEQRPLSSGAAAFDDLHHRRTTAAKILLRPQD